MTAQPVVTAKFKAAIDLLGRTGASGFEIRWSGDPELSVFRRGCE